MSETNFESITEQFLISIKKFSNSTKKIYSVAYPVPNFEIMKIVDPIHSSGFNFMSFSSPSNDRKFLGTKSLLDSETFSPDNNYESFKTIDSLSKNIISNHKMISLEGIPFFLSGIKFNVAEHSELWSDFPSVFWFVPEIVFYQTGLNCFMIINFYSEIITKPEILSLYKFAAKLMSSGNDSSKCTTIRKSVDSSEHVDWENRTNSMLQLIKAGELKKIVLSRQVVYKITSNIGLFYLLGNLEKNYPNTTVFMYYKNNSVFFGATPELLLSIEKNTITIDALAGSAPRGINSNEDFKIESDLLQNLKNRNEQQYVVDFIVESLSQVSKNIEFDKIPKIKKLSNIQHLWTSIKAETNGKQSVISLLNLIYPTPAICGIPTIKAKEKIIESEIHSRGLYSGIIGWLDEKLDGKFYVAIRSALIKNEFLYLFAGCGIVDGSDPKLEFEETELKFNAILSLFENEKTN